MTKYRRPLNPEQQEILHILYRFRFATTDLIAKYQNRKNGTAVFNRLKVLCDQEYIGRNFENSYRLQGKPASYFLLTKGINVLKADPDYDKAVLHATHKDKTAKDQFVNHWLTIFRAYKQLTAIYGDPLDTFTKSELTTYKCFPEELPDAYISLKSGYKAKTKHFILLAFEEATPHFVYVKRVKEIIEHSEEPKNWEDAFSKYPTILMICESVKQQRSLQPRIAKAIEDEVIEEPDFYLTNRDAVASMTESDDAIWQLVTDPIIMRSLRQM
jgi:hypothetical protein